jgi:hypothetical protein
MAFEYKGLQLCNQRSSVTKHPGEVCLPEWTLQGYRVSRVRGHIPKRTVHCVFYDSVEFLLRSPIRDLSLVYDIDTNIDWLIGRFSLNLTWISCILSPLSILGTFLVPRLNHVADVRCQQHWRHSSHGAKLYGCRYLDVMELLCISMRTCKIITAWWPQYFGVVVTGDSF